MSSEEKSASSPTVDTRTIAEMLNTTQVVVRKASQKGYIPYIRESPKSEYRYALNQTESIRVGVRKLEAELEAEREAKEAAREATVTAQSMTAKLDELTNRVMSLERRLAFHGDRIRALENPLTEEVVLEPEGSPYHARIVRTPDTTRAHV